MAKRDDGTQVSRVSETAAYRESFPVKIALEDYMGQDFTLTKVRIVEGDKAEYAVFVAYLDLDGQPLTFSCGGFAIVDFFKNPANADVFPVVAAFRKEGAMWIME